MQRPHRRDMHRRRKDIVRGLPLVDVVVRMHQTLLAAAAAENFRRTVGEHLVHVHVGLGAGAGLPDHQGKFVVMLSGDDLVRCLDNGVAFLCVEQAEFDVHHRGGALHQRQRADQFHRHALARNSEVVKAALGLRAPQAVSRDFDLAETVSLHPCRCHRYSPKSQNLNAEAQRSQRTQRKCYDRWPESHRLS